jgi:hypothetical protein
MKPNNSRSVGLRQGGSTVTDLKYPMGDLLTDTMMPLAYLNTLTAWYLLLLTAPWLFMQAWMKALEG